MFHLFKKRSFWLLIENNSEFLGPKYLAYGPFASRTKADLQRLSWSGHAPVIKCLDIVQEVPHGYIKQEIL